MVINLDLVSVAIDLAEFSKHYCMSLVAEFLAEMKKAL